MIYVTCVWKLHSWQFILLHTYLRFLYHKTYSPFLHIYCLVSCCLTSATVIYITMLWMQIVLCWWMLSMKLLHVYASYTHDNLCCWQLINLMCKHKVREENTPCAETSIMDWGQKVSAHLMLTCVRLLWYNNIKITT